MTSKRSPRPVESFGPEIFQALIEGAKRKITLELPYRKAVYFRLRANQLRNQMRLLSHPQYSVVSQTRITIAWPPSTPVRQTSKRVSIPLDVETPCTLTIAPSDSEFTEALARAGVNVPQLTNDDSPTTAPQGGESTEDILASFLKKA